MIDGSLGRTYARRLLAASLLAASLLAASLHAVLPLPLLAQASGVVRDPAAGFATRAELEARAADAEREAVDSAANRELSARRRREAAAIRARLRSGDFTVGDAIAVRIEGAGALSDTVTVRKGPHLILPEYAPLPLEGVLRSELRTRLTDHLAQYIRSPQVSVTPLMRLGVFGSVGRPGFYVIQPDALLSDVIMAAGGPAAAADPEAIAVRRGDTVLVDAARARAAIREGITLDQLDLHGGDELTVGEKRRTSWTGIIQGVGIVVTIVSLAIGLNR